MMILVWSYQYKIMVKCLNVFNLDIDADFISTRLSRKWTVLKIERFTRHRMRRAIAMLAKPQIGHHRSPNLSPI